MSSSTSRRSWCKSWGGWCREQPPCLGTALVVRGVASAEYRGQGPTFWLAECLPQQRERVWLTKTFEVFPSQVIPASFQKTEKANQTDLMDLLEDTMDTTTAGRSSAGPWLGMRKTPSPSLRFQAAAMTDLTEEGLLGSLD